MLAICLAAAGAALGCTPKIGDDCTVSTNCSTTGDRLCDVTQPGGYCTVFNCEPGSCPEDSVCVNFGTTLSTVQPVSACTPSQANSPYKRSFCMANCADDSDCRGGYRCLTASKDCMVPSATQGHTPSCFNAVLAEHASSQKVCAVPPKPPPTGTSTEVCVGSDAGPADGVKGEAGSGG